MKKLLVTMIMCFVVFNIMAQEVPEFIDGTDDVETRTFNREQRGGRDVPSIGNMKACIIYVDSPGEADNSTNWPLNGDPTYMNSLINDTPDAIDPQMEDGNFSTYYQNMSNGLNLIYGDSYRYTLPNNVDDYGNVTSLNTAVLTGINDALPNLNFSEYDNWTKNASYDFTEGPDGIMDMVIIIYRTSPSYIIYTAKARLECEAGLTLDGIEFNFTSGICQYSGINSYYYNKFVLTHEYAHYLLGTGHTGELALLAGLPTILSAIVNQEVCVLLKKKL